MTKSTWILLSEARSKLLRMWLQVFALMTIFLLIQTSTGMIQGIKRIVWGWHFLCLFPGLVLLLGSTWLKRHTDKVLNPNIYYSLFGLEVIYILLVILVFLLSRKTVDMNEYGLDVYYLKSLWILAPINLLVLSGLVIVLYFKKSISKPNLEEIRQLVQKKVEIADVNQYAYQVSCIKNIREGETKTALENMSKWFEKNNSVTYDELLMLQARHSLLLKDLSQGIISSSDFKIELNRIIIILIDIVKDIKG